MTFTNPFNVKRAFVPSDAAMAAQAPPPPGGAPPMDPAMAGGGMPPPEGDPMAMGGAPPMDPSMDPSMMPPDPAAGGGPVPTTTPPDPLAGQESPDIGSIVQQAVTQAIQALGLGGEGGAGGAGAKGKGGAGKPDLVAMQNDLYQVKQLVIDLRQQMGLEIPASALDTPNHPAKQKEEGGSPSPGGGGAEKTSMFKRRTPTVTDMIKLAAEVLSLYADTRDYVDDPWKLKQEIATMYDAQKTEKKATHIVSRQIWGEDIEAPGYPVVSPSKSIPARSPSVRELIRRQRGY